MYMSWLISFVLADSNCEPHEESENYKIRNSCPQRDSKVFVKMTKSNILPPILFEYFTMEEQ